MEFRNAKLVEDVLRLPALRPSARRTVSVRAPKTLPTLFRKAIAALKASAAAGDAADSAIWALLPANHAPMLAAIVKSLAGKLVAPTEAEVVGGDRAALDLDALSPLIYEHAVDAVADERTDEALMALALVAASPAGRADGLLGLSVCAVRLQNYDAARVLAIETLKHRPGHPRAGCIAGRCELERGDRKAAQHYLAMAARMARQKPEFRDDLRAAQRLLLMMHIA